MAHTDTNTQNNTPGTAGEITQDILAKNLGFTPASKKVLLVLGVLFAIGVVTFVLRAIDVGFEDRSHWGYYAAVFAFLFTACSSAPMLALVPRLTKASWGKPMHRAAELFAVVGLFNFIIFIPMLFMLPSGSGRFTMWFVSNWREGWPPGAPHTWDMLGLLGLALTGMALLYVSSLPDFAVMRDHSTGSRRKLYSLLASNWHGSKKQWFFIKNRVGILGAFYFMMLIFTHYLISVDFSMSLVPGWKDAIYPAFHALQGLQCAVAMTLLGMFMLRQFGGLKNYIGLDQFWGPAKLLLASSLLWFYFWWSGFIIYWYGRTPAEQDVLKFIMFESYRTPFFIAFVLCFVVPLTMLIWNRIRKSILGPTLIGLSVLIGTFFHRIAVYVSAFSTKDVSAHSLGGVPAATLPNVGDVLMIIGAIAGAAAVYLIASKIIPTVSMWEVKENLLYRRESTFKRTKVLILGKPE